MLLIFAVVLTSSLFWKLLCVTIISVLLVPLFFLLALPRFHWPILRHSLLCILFLMLTSFHLCRTSKVFASAFVSPFCRRLRLLSLSTKSRRRHLLFDRLISFFIRVKLFPDHGCFRCKYMILTFNPYWFQYNNPHLNTDFLLVSHNPK